MLVPVHGCLDVHGWCNAFAGPSFRAGGGTYKSAGRCDSAAGLDAIHSSGERRPAAAVDVVGRQVLLRDAYRSPGNTAAAAAGELKGARSVANDVYRRWRLWNS